jgi:GNAT superfamily N-acetyltransferase
MTLRDWRGADPAVVRDCYERERRHWDAGLGWDTTWTWAQVEQARTARQLPGYLATDASGGVCGWTFFLIDAGTLHIGGMVADAPATTALLLDGVLAAAADNKVAAVACFVLDRAAGLDAALAARGYAVEPFLYLSRDLPPDGGRDEGARDRPPSGGRDTVVLAEAWRDDDRGAVAMLLRQAYDAEGGRHFATDGNWERYLGGVVDQAGCGVFDRALTRVVRRGADIDAVALVTSVSADTAHLAQLAVTPPYRGKGLATSLVQQTIDAAAQVGRRHVTLIVSELNAPARRVYGRLGFAPRARFVAARARTGAAAAEVS